MKPQDIRSFALVSRRINQLSSPFVEHELFRKLFSEVRIRPGSNNGRAAELFRDMFQDPRAKFHLRDLQAEKWPHHWECPRYCEPLKGTIANLQNGDKELARCLDKVPAKRLLKGVRDGEESQFLAFQFKRLIGWTELKSSDTVHAHSDLFQKLEHVLFPSDMSPATRSSA